MGRPGTQSRPNSRPWQQGQIDAAATAARGEARKRGISMPWHDSATQSDSMSEWTKNN